MRSRQIVSCVLLGLMVAGVNAQPVASAAKPAPKLAVKPADKPVWAQLSKTQQAALEPLHAEWDPMEGVRKQKWLALAKSYATMKPEEQQRVHERMREWIKLTPEQRKVARQNYTQSKTIAPDQKSATWESYKQLPDEQKQKLAGQASRKQLTNLPPAKATPRGTAAAAVAGNANGTAAAAPANTAATAPAPAR
jgi:hypothetical protein